MSSTIPNYFSFTPTGGPEPKQSFAAGFFATAMAQSPKPQTLAIVGADAEFPHNAMDGARAIAKQDGLKIVYDKTYPPTTTDYTPIVRAIQATNPDLVLVCSYPPDTVGMIRAAHEVGLKAKLFGGGMVGLQSTAIKTQLGPLLNGIVDYDFWLPWSKLASPEAKAFLEQYQAKGRLPPASIRSAITCRHSRTATCRCCSRRWRAPRASIRTSSPITCVRTRSRPWLAT